jgi:hypothetical protein
MHAQKLVFIKVPHAKLALRKHCQDWRRISRGSGPALQVRSPEFKPQSLKTKKTKKKGKHCQVNYILADD